MKFTRVPVHHMDKPQSGQTPKVWHPAGHSSDLQPAAGQSEIVEADLEGTVRGLGGDAVRMAMRFSMNPKRRARLGHDALVFALANESGIDPAEQVFNRPGGKIIRVGNLIYPAGEDPTEEPNVMAGHILFTASDPSPEADIRTVRPHFLVRASIDRLAPHLYFSKLGAGGPVVLSSLEDLKGFYDIKAVGRASMFHTLPFEAR